MIYQDTLRLGTSTMKETACSDRDRLPELVCPPGRWEDAVWEEDESEEQEEGAEEGGGGSSR